VLFPGDRNPDEGPDFLEAVLQSEDGRLFWGDVELHIRSRDWYAHGHDTDSRYDGVVLHVVLEDNDVRPAVRSTGEEVPLLVVPSGIETLIGASDTADAPGPESRGAGPFDQAQDRRPSDDRAIEVLASLGDERFHKRVRDYLDALLRQSAETLLYQEILRALGYPRNQDAFLALARIIMIDDLKRATRAVHSCSEREMVAQALLLGAAGLLPSQRGIGQLDDYLDGLETRWRDAAIRETVPLSLWSFTRSRPAAIPPRRVAAAAILLARFSHRGLLASMTGLLEHESLNAFEEALTVVSTGFWAWHGDVRHALAKPLPTLLGRERARSLLINAILPFLAAYGWREGAQRMAQRAHELYSSAPALEQDRVVRRMVKRIWNENGARRMLDARSQQGLHHLFREFCTNAGCALCPLFADRTAVGAS
jgi:hypothetical protein